MNQKDTQTDTQMERKIVTYQDIYYLMHYGLPVKYPVRDGYHPGEYVVSDASGTVGVRVRFAVEEGKPGYVYELDDQGPERAEWEDVERGICREIHKKLFRWIGNSPRRRSMVMMKACMHRMKLHPGGIPMAFLSPDAPDQTLDPAQIKARRVQFQRELDKNVRTVGFGYHQIRGVYVNQNMDVNGQVYFLLYGKPDKKSEQLLKSIAEALGKKYDQQAVGFRDIQGHTSAICMPGVSACVEPVVSSENLHISEGYGPIEKFNSTSSKLRRRNAFRIYCDACWDEETETYQFDDRFHNYF